jgi:hypothetical protein
MVMRTSGQTVCMILILEHKDHLIIDWRLESAAFSGEMSHYYRQTSTLLFYLTISVP